MQERQRRAYGLEHHQRTPCVVQGEVARVKTEEEACRGRSLSLPSSSRHGTATNSSIVPTILSFAINCSDRHCVRTILPRSAIALLSRLHELGVVDMGRAAGSNYKGVTAKETDRKERCFIAVLVVVTPSEAGHHVVHARVLRHCYGAVCESRPLHAFTRKESAIWRYLAFPEEAASLAT